MSMIRSRWAAVGAAVAVSLGAGGIGLVSATTSSGERTVLTTLDQPCRIASLRPAPLTVGPRPVALGADETYTIGAHGPAGSCNLPSDAVALSMNVTALNATQNTNLRFWAAGTTKPTTANLNPSGGAPPIGNAVTTGLSTDGRFNVYNFQGNVQIVIDVLGYYTDHNHDDRYYTKAQTDQISTRPFVVMNAASTIAIEAGSGDTGDLANTLTVTAPGPGQFIVTASGNYSALLSEGLHPNVQCSLTNSGVFDSGYRSLYEVWNATPPSGNERSEADLSIVRVVDVDSAGDMTFDILCRESSGGQRVLVVSRIIAQYVP